MKKINIPDDNDRPVKIDYADWARQREEYEAKREVWGLLLAIPIWMIVNYFLFS